MNLSNKIKEVIVCLFLIVIGYVIAISISNNAMVNEMVGFVSFAVLAILALFAIIGIVGGLNKREQIGVQI